MGDRSSLAAIVLAMAGLGMAATGARALDDAKYPDIRGAWERPGAAQWDPTKPGGLRQQAPLTPQFQAVFEANLAETAAGGQEYNTQVKCLPSGMPRVMIAYEPLELLVTPEITYIRFDQLGENRRIYTDGRPWPEKVTPSFDGYSIGKWVDPDADGRYGALEVETRALKGPRNLDASGLPLHPDNATIIKERIFLDPANRNRLHDRITTIDHAYSQPGLQPHGPSALGRDQLQRRKPLRFAREGNVFHQPRWLSDADQEESANARSEEFRAITQVTQVRSVRRRDCWSIFRKSLPARSCNNAGRRRSRRRRVAQFPAVAHRKSARRFAGTCRIHQCACDERGDITSFDASSSHRHVNNQRPDRFAACDADQRDKRQCDAESRDKHEHVRAQSQQCASQKAEQYNATHGDRFPP
jgi:hypothetical protein